MSWTDRVFSARYTADEGSDGLIYVDDKLGSSLSNGVNGEPIFLGVMPQGDVTARGYPLGGLGVGCVSDCTVPYKNRHYSTPEPRLYGIVFPGIALSASENSTINNTYLVLNCYDGGSSYPPGSPFVQNGLVYPNLTERLSLPVTVRIYGEASVNPVNTTASSRTVQFPSYALSSRIRTSASVTWTLPVSTRFDDAVLYSPDITAIISEIISLPGWVSGNQMAIFVEYVSGFGVRRVNDPQATTPTPFAFSNRWGQDVIFQTPAIEVHRTLPMPPPSPPPRAPIAAPLAPGQVLAPGEVLVPPGEGTLQAALDLANAGDVLVLADGEFYGSLPPANWGGHSYLSPVIRINQSVTIRALNPGQAVIVSTGLNRWSVFAFENRLLREDAVITLDGLNITSQNVRAPGSDTHPAPLSCTDLCSPSLLCARFTTPFPAHILSTSPQRLFSRCMFVLYSSRT